MDKIYYKVMTYHDSDAECYGLFESYDSCINFFNQRKNMKLATSYNIIEIESPTCRKCGKHMIDNKVKWHYQEFYCPCSNDEAVVTNELDVSYISA